MVAGTLSALSAEVYVSPSGSDTNPGTKELPFATVVRARDEVRKLRKGTAGPITVYLRGGTHYLSQPLVLTAADSGSPGAPVTYAAFEGEEPVISGGVRLELDWRTHKDGIMRADVPGVKAGELEFDQIFVNGRRLHMARYPNYDDAARYFGGTSPDAISPERVKRWSNPAGGFVHGLHKYGWASQHYRIAGANEDGSLKLEGGWQNNRRTELHKDVRFVENIFEELDAPGEWFIDRAAGVLYLIPPAGVDISNARVEAAGIRHLLEIRGTRQEPARFIAIRGLTLTHTARTFMETKEPLLRSDWCIYRGGAVLIEGAEDCSVAGCFFDAVGGNAVFVSRYCRRVEVTGCRITEAGAGAICFVGDPEAARSPGMNYGDIMPLDRIDRTPGPKTPDYPAQCRAHDNLIHGIGKFEKQVAGVHISMAEEITVSHNSIYDVPRAGINIADGTWGGHVIEFNDVFDTVKETADHGAFNSWGRDRYWSPDRRPVDVETALLDAWKTTTLRNNRWQCAHGWDIDLDDGSSNYHIANNLCLQGGLKLREGFRRTAENNILVNNTVYPQLWYKNCGDVILRNICWTDYKPYMGNAPKPWGEEIDRNLWHKPGQKTPAPWKTATGHDRNSIVADARFADPAKGDYRVTEGSPALELGFANFPMDRFGVVSPRLKALARSPLTVKSPTGQPKRREAAVRTWLGAKVKNLVGLEEVSATGMYDETGVLVTEVAIGSAAEAAGLRANDVILSLGGVAVPDVEALVHAFEAAPAGAATAVEVFRTQGRTTLSVRK